MDERPPALPLTFYMDREYVLNAFRAALLIFFFASGILAYGQVKDQKALITLYAVSGVTALFILIGLRWLFRKKIILHVNEKGIDIPSSIFPFRMAWEDIRGFHLADAGTRTSMTMLSVHPKDLEAYYDSLPLHMFYMAKWTNSSTGAPIGIGTCFIDIDNALLVRWLEHYRIIYSDKGVA